MAAPLSAGSYKQPPSAANYNKAKNTGNLSSSPELNAILQNQIKTELESRTQIFAPPPSTFDKKKVMQNAISVATEAVRVMEKSPEDGQPQGVLLYSIVPVLCDGPSADHSKLIPIHLNEMSTNVRMRGRCLVGRTLLRPTLQSGVTTVLQTPEDGLCIRLQLHGMFLHNPTLDMLNDVLPVNSTILIKEPMLRAVNGVPIMVMVQNPADLIIVTRPVPSCFTPATCTTLDLLREGQMALDQNRIHLARRIFDEILIQREPTNADAFSLRAETFLQEQLFVSALRDATRAVNAYAANHPNLYRAHQRRAEALWNLHAMQEAAHAVTLAFETWPKNVEGKTIYAHIVDHANQLVKQSKDGVVDILRLAQLMVHVLDKLPQGDRIPLFAPYQGHVEVTKAYSGGMVLCASHDIACGEILSISLPLCRLNMLNDHCQGIMCIDPDRNVLVGPSKMDFHGHLVRRCMDDPWLNQRVKSLWAGDVKENRPIPTNIPGERLKMAESMCDGDMSRGSTGINSGRIRQALLLNCFGIRDDDTTTSTWGVTNVHDMISFCDHSCAPNVTSSHFTRALILTANRPIVRGEQITIPYVTGASWRHAERANALNNWQFRCGCERCTMEVKQQDTIAEVDKIITQHPKLDVLDDAIKRLMKPVNDRQMNLMRACFLVPVTEWEKKASASGNQLESARITVWLVDVLDALGSGGGDGYDKHTILINLVTTKRKFLAKLGAEVEARIVKLHQRSCMIQYKSKTYQDVGNNTQRIQQLYAAFKMMEE